jgi:hypothetical protein
VHQAVDLVHGSMVDWGQGGNPRYDQGCWSRIGWPGMRARDQAAADAFGPLAADPTAASDGRRRGWQVQRRTTACGGEARRSSLDLELPAMIWNASGLYTELGRQRTRLEDQGGSSGNHNDATSGEAARPSPASMCGKERRGAPGLERR